MTRDVGGQFAAPSPEQFEFWCGRWTVTSLDEDGTELRGSNEVVWRYPRTVLEETFELPQQDGTVYRGTSLSVAVPGRGWCQTWADSQGNYLDFVGGWTGEAMILERVAHAPSRRIRQRMHWRDITAGGFGWDWLASDDDGRTWALRWHLDYRRS